MSGSSLGSRTFMGLKTQSEEIARGLVLKACLHHKHALLISIFVSCHFGGEVLMEIGEWG